MLDPNFAGYCWKTCWKWSADSSSATYGIFVSHKIQGSYDPVRVVEPTLAKNLKNLIDVIFLCLLLQMCFSRPSHFC